jgi:hypothetical protein
MSEKTKAAGRCGDTQAAISFLHSHFTPYLFPLKAVPFRYGTWISVIGGSL